MWLFKTRELFTEKKTIFAVNMIEKSEKNSKEIIEPSKQFEIMFPIFLRLENLKLLYQNLF